MLKIMGLPLGLAALLLADGPAVAEGMLTSCAGIPCFVGATVITTTTDARIDTLHDTRLSASVAEFRTELRGRLQGDAPLYDAILDVAFADPQIAATIPGIESLLAIASSSPLTFSGPVLTSSVQSSSASTASVVDHIDVASYVAPAVDTFGPQIITLSIYPSADVVAQGASETCTGITISTPAASGSAGVGTPTGCTGGSPFFVVSGQLDIDLTVTTVVDTFQTTTDTTTLRTTEVYDIVGLPRAPSAVPEPSGVGLLVTGLLGIGALGRRSAAASGRVRPSRDPR